MIIYTSKYKPSKHELGFEVELDSRLYSKFSRLATKVELSLNEWYFIKTFYYNIDFWEYNQIIRPQESTYPLKKKTFFS